MSHCLATNHVDGLKEWWPKTIVGDGKVSNQKFDDKKCGDYKVGNQKCGDRKTNNWKGGDWKMLWSKG